MDEYYRILESLPPALRTPLAKLDAHYAPHIQEIRLRPDGAPAVSCSPAKLFPHLFHSDVENSYFSTVHNRLYMGQK